MMYPSMQQIQDTVTQNRILNQQEAMAAPIPAQLERVRQEALDTQLRVPQLQRQEEIRMNQALLNQGRNQFNQVNSQLYTVQNKTQDQQNAQTIEFNDQYVKMIAASLARGQGFGGR